MTRVRTYKELNYKERANIAKERLLNPEEKKQAFAKANNIDIRALSTIEDKLNFDKDTAVWALLSSIMAKDNALIELSTDIKQKWAESVWAKRTILTKDIDTLDKIENSAMKRALLLKASDDAEKNDETLDINITL